MTGHYDMYFRSYDPALGRMLALDPVAAKYSSVTPYNYAFNNPIAWNDPLGDEPDGDINSYDDYWESYQQWKSDVIGDDDLRVYGGRPGGACMTCGFLGYGGSGINWGNPEASWNKWKANNILAGNIEPYKDGFSLRYNQGTWEVRKGYWNPYALSTDYATWVSAGGKTELVKEGGNYQFFLGSWEYPDQQSGGIDLGNSNLTELFNSIMSGLYEGHRDGKTMLEVFDFTNADRNFKGDAYGNNIKVFNLNGVIVKVNLIKPINENTPLPIVKKQPENIYGVAYPRGYSTDIGNGKKTNFPFVYKFYDYEMGTVSEFSFHINNDQAFSNFISFMNTGKEIYKYD